MALSIPKASNRMLWDKNPRMIDAIPSIVIQIRVMYVSRSAVRTSAALSGRFGAGTLDTVGSATIGRLSGLAICERLTFRAVV